MSPPCPDITDLELEQFDSFAKSPAMGSHAMDAGTLQGLAVALAIGPTRVLPSIWLPWVWDRDAGLRPPPFASVDEANAIVALVMRQFNAVVAAFEREPVDFVPLFRYEAQWGAAEFCAGFLIGIRLAPADWAPLEAADPGALAPMRAVAAGGDDLDAAIADIVPSLHAVHRFWRVGGSSATGQAPDVWQRVRMGLKWLERPFPAAAVKLAEAHREEVAPHLVQVLAAIADDPTLVLEGEYTLHLFAMHLLAGWRDRRAFAPLLKLGQFHDPEVIDSLFGELVHESYGRCLASVSGGDVAPMMALADDALADIWVRSAVLGGLTACVIEGEADRERVVAYLQAAAEREAAAMRAGRPAHPQTFEPIDAIVSQLTDLCAAESLPAIRGWFAEGLLDTQHCDLAFVERHIALPPAEASARLLAQKQGYVANAAREMSWWYMFDPQSRSSEQDSISLPDPVPPQPVVRQHPKIGRNDPCPCGSGRKYKKCHGAN